MSAGGPTDRSRAEEMELKLEIFTIFDKFATPDAILASNTVSLSIAEIGRDHLSSGELRRHALRLIPCRNESCSKIVRAPGNFR